MTLSSKPSTPLELEPSRLKGQSGYKPKRPVNLQHLMQPSGTGLFAWSALSDREADQQKTLKMTGPRLSNQQLLDAAEPWTPDLQATPTIPLHDFLRGAWRLLEPAVPFVDSWHIRLFCEHLEAISTHQLPEPNLLINTPPGTSKSLMFSVLWPAWTWIWAPWTRWLTASYDEGLAVRDAVRTRRLMNTEWYRKLVTEQWTFVGDQNVKRNYLNDKTGWRIATSIKGGITGHHAHVVLVDDPHHVRKAESDIERDATLASWREVFPSRVLPGGIRVLVGQRTHELDTTADWLARERDDIHHIELRMEYEVPPKGGDHDGELRDSLHETAAGECSLTHRPHDARSREGDLLIPERFPRPVLERRKVELGPYAYAGQYQQSPTPRAGMVLDPAWIMQTPDQQDFSHMDTVMVWDLNYSSRDASDWTVGMLASVERTGELPKIYIRGVYRDHVNEIDHERVISEEIALYKPLLVGIEKRAFEKQGATIDLVRRVTLRLDRLKIVSNIEPVEADTDKVSRAMIIPGRARAGLILADKRNAWWNDLSREMSVFPRGAHDDQVDCLAHLVRLVVEKLSNVRAQRILLGHSSHVRYVDSMTPARPNDFQRLAEAVR